MSIKDYLFLCEQLGITITFKGVQDDGTIAGLSKGDRLFFMENMSRATKTDLRTYWEKRPDEDIYWYELERLQKAVESYKHSRGKMDFTDMVARFIKDSNPPAIRALIVDEAQDLTALQWDAVELLSRDTDETYIAGDDDQAIFNWAGASVSTFIGLHAKREVLPQSYRVPAKIQEVANTIIGRCSTRIPKTWNPTQDIGDVHYVNDIDQISMDQGSWLLIARNVYLLQEYTDYCLRQGYIFDSITESPIKGNTVTAIRYWEALRRGEELTVEHVKVVYEYLSSRVGVMHGFKAKLDRAPEGTRLNIMHLKCDYGLLTDKIWHEALDRIAPSERDYYIAAVKRGEKLTQEPRIRINTIHGVKGGEADNVVLQCDMAFRTWNEYHNNQDDEHRVWYVGVTRARKSLYVISPKTDRAYDI